MTDLGELIERVIKATGPDRDVDRAVAHAVFGVSWTSDDYAHDGCPAYTASLDAVVALAEKVLGPMFINLQISPRSSHYAGINKEGVGPLGAAMGRTPALALLLAVLRASAAA